ncbi:MAG TPA: tRNA 2-thiouridine(34) synthase MnmA [Syntrophobacteraceae bacterium]|nr:tRNA 2-thiouridine(34) synthase MnmA [Syntrophobacteraceae bacterium]
MTAPGKRIVAAMSGGVDSSVAAGLLLEQGFEVVGVTLQLQACDESGGGRSCCGTDSIAQARAAAGRLGIHHYVIDCRQEFEKTVLLPSWEEYSRGRTPNPCVICNERVKFGMLFDHAVALGAYKLATGHYARVGMRKNGAPFLRRGADHRKDQSYFLFSIRPEALSGVVFPIGEFTKDAVRSLAQHLGLPNADRRESQDACFAAKETGYPEGLRRRLHKTTAPGPLVDEEGRLLGMHKGIHQFTVGQRRGLGVALGSPAWVKSIDPWIAAVVLTTREQALSARGLRASGVRWIGFVPRFRRLRCSIKVRYNQAPAPATVEPGEEATAKVWFDRPLRAVTPGQAVVFFHGDRVLGGGWIERSER